MGAVVFGTMVQLTHSLLLTLLQVTVTEPVAGHPVEGHVAVPSPDALNGNGLIKSLYSVPPESKLTPSLQLPLDVRTFASGTVFPFWSKQRLLVCTPSEK